PLLWRLSGPHGTPAFDQQPLSPSVFSIGGSCFSQYGAVSTTRYSLSLHDALPIWNAQGLGGQARVVDVLAGAAGALLLERLLRRDRKSTRLNSSHVKTSYAVFCLKKKNVPLDVPAYDPRFQSTAASSVGGVCR